MLDEDVVLYERRGAVAWVTLNRPRYRNAQNSAMLYALDGAFHRAAMDDEVRVIVLAGAGPCFSAGHDMGSPGQDLDVSYPRITMWPDHVAKPAIEGRLNREAEVYLELCRRWRDLPKPTIAMVHGACVGGGLALAWVCDLIIASEDAFFADPSVGQGGSGVEWFAHPFQMAPRLAKEFLFLGERVDAIRARELGMVNRVVPRAELEAATMEIAERIAAKPAFGLAIAKRNVNFAEDAMGLRQGLEHSFGWHQLVHAHREALAGPPTAPPQEPRPTAG
ncbi:MAG TPA: enoyl-CoA hydratase [Candidatus Dormibacteraeota bacterium]|nr:enoyl-CoA hydratase [Candidatus Dormibacteraeota bacterium]